LARAVLGFVITRIVLIWTEILGAVPLLPWLHLAGESRRRLLVCPGGNSLLLLRFHGAVKWDSTLDKKSKSAVARRMHGTWNCFAGFFQTVTGEHQMI
jgi:hypothetical protein